jgi:hypothetical protein
MNAIFSKKAPDGVIAGDSLRDRKSLMRIRIDRSVV